MPSHRPPDSSGLPLKRTVALRLGRRGFGGLVAALALGVGALAPLTPSLEADRRALVADGQQVARVRVVWRSALGLPAAWAKDARLEPDRDAEASLGAVVLPAHDGSLVIRAGRAPGALAITLRDHAAAALELRFAPSLEDRDGDGLPDVMELRSEEDRAAFVGWFTNIAEAQASVIDDAWAPIHRDCAGLVRFAVREALKAHDEAWLGRRRGLPLVGLPDVRGLRYPHLPVGGDRPFRAVGGAFDPARPVEAQLTAAPSARTLWLHNTSFVGRRLEEARAGDLLFFAAPEPAGSGQHTMIVLGARPGATHAERGARLVYHTGQDGSAGGEVRLVSFEQLLAHPEPSWRPVPHNPRFLGVHRLSLLEGNRSIGPVALEVPSP